jgi:thiamine biosynthesis lipoprotein
VSWRRDVFQTMGTVASLTFHSHSDAQTDLSRVQSTFDRYDGRYSLFKPESEISRIALGALALPDASPEMRETYALALGWRAATHGEFTPHRPDGVIDLSGVVKALAMRAAGLELDRSGVRDWCMNVGGDVLVSGIDETGQPWSVGIVDPDERSELLTAATLQGTRRACATSGSSERGDHIWTIGAATTEFVQATVIADDIVTADVLATAIIAGGTAALDRACATWNIDVMTVGNEGELRMTPGFTTRVPSER